MGQTTRSDVTRMMVCKHCTSSISLKLNYVDCATEPVPAYARQGSLFSLRPSVFLSGMKTIILSRHIMHRFSCYHWISIDGSNVSVIGILLRYSIKPLDRMSPSSVT